MLLAKEAGFDGIEIGIVEDGELNLNSSDAQIRALRQMAEDIGLEIPSLVAGLYWKNRFTSNDQEIREKAIDIAKRHLETAALLGANTVLMVPGVVSGLENSAGEAVQYDIAYERALQAMRELAPFARGVGVSIGVENVWNKFLLSPIEMRDFIDKIGSEYVGAYFDVGNVVLFGYPEQWIRILGKRIKKVHLKDFRRKVGTIDGFVDLLAGDVDWPEVMRALKEIGYDDYITAEMAPPYRFSPEQLIFNTARSMNQILQMA